MQELETNPCFNSGWGSALIHTSTIEMQRNTMDSCHAVYDVDLLQSGSIALDIVEAVVKELETDPCFKSCQGLALTCKGTIEMEANIMDSCGLVAATTMPSSGLHRQEPRLAHSVCYGCGCHFQMFH